LTKGCRFLAGSKGFLETTLQDRGTRRDSQLEGGRYSNMTMTYNGCIGHGGFGGQYMLADPRSETVVVFFSVLETIDAGDNIVGARETPFLAV